MRGAAHAVTALGEAYAATRPGSAARFERAKRSLPGAETRAVTHYPPFPTIIDHGSGAFLTDVDGHRYLDLVNNYTSLVHGNAHPEIAAAVEPVLRRGTAFAALHELQLDLAEALVARVPAVELLRFTNSGSEASALALRIARRATGRRSLTMIESGYHGALPPFTAGEPEVVRTPFEDVAALERTITAETAAVFVEPFLGAGGVLPLSAAFLQAIQARAAEVGAVFVVDEVQALRVAPGGMAPGLGLEPDLVTLGKVIGGGFPIGAVGGRADLLELTSPFTSGRLDHAGTFNGGLPAMAGGLVSLRLLDEHAIDGMNARATRLADAIEAAGADAGLPVAVSRAGSILHVHPGGAPVSVPSDANRDPAFSSALHLALMLEGAYTTPRGMINLSTVIGDAELEEAAAAYRAAFARLSRLGAA